MAHHKNRSPKRIKGCCSMCATRGHDMGVRNKRLPTPRDMRAPTVAEQLAEMCSCPACRVGCEDRCFASIVLPPDVALPEAWCAACGSYYCDGLGAPAFCETR